MDQQGSAKKQQCPLLRTEMRQMRGQQQLKMASFRELRQ